MGKVRVRHGDSEIEIDGSDAFIKKQLDLFYGRLGRQGPDTKVSLRDQLLTEAPAPKTGGKDPTPAEYYKQKGKTDGVSQILVFGRYLEQFRNKAEFTKNDVNKVAEEAKLSKDIHSQYFTNAVKQGLLRKRGQNYSLTLSAEELLGK